MKIDMNKSIDLWKILLEQLKIKAPFTYGEVSEKLGKYPANELRHILSPIQEYCIEKNLPRLTSIVVNKETRMPGDGYKGIQSYKELYADQEEVYNYDWSSQSLNFINSINPKLIITEKNNIALNSSINNTILEEENLESIETDKSYSEGTKKHFQFEKRIRNSTLVKEAKAFFKENNNGILFCEICNFNFDYIYGKSYIEAHHKVPLLELNENTNTKIEDLAMLCANCHRMIHLYNKNGCLSIQELKNKIRNKNFKSI